MLRTILTTLGCIFLASFFLGCAPAKSKTEKKAAGKDDHGHAEDAKHGGAILEVGAHVAHLEFVHDEKEGKATVYVTGKDAKTPLAIAEAPKINLQTDAGPKSLQTAAIEGKEGKASQFSVTDDALKSDHLKGVIVVTIEGKAYRPDIKEAHGHDHDGHEHDKDHGHEKDHDEKSGHDHDEKKGHDDDKEHGHDHD